MVKYNINLWPWPYTNTCIDLWPFIRSFGSLTKMTNMIDRKNPTDWQTKTTFFTYNISLEMLLEEQEYIENGLKKSLLFVFIGKSNHYIHISKFRFRGCKMCFFFKIYAIIIYPGLISVCRRTALYRMDITHASARHLATLAVILHRKSTIEPYASLSLGGCW